MHPVKKYRKSRNISQKALAGDFQISKAYLSLIETGDRPVPAELAYRIEKKSGGEVRADEINELIREIRAEHCCKSAN